MSKPRQCEISLQLVERHPYKVDVIGSSPVFPTTSSPPDVGIIVEQHHEQPYGTGFPVGLTAINIAPLSSVFIVSHEICDAVYAGGIKDFNAKEFLDKKAATYSSGYFKKVHKVLCDSLLG